MKPHAPLPITGLGCLTSLGHNARAHVAALASAPPDFKPLGTLIDLPPSMADVPAGWIMPREMLSHRKWSPATCATLHVARQAIEDAAWSEDECRSAGIVFGTSRGTAAGWLDEWPGRRPFGLMAASNSLASEPAAAVAHEFGIEGNWHVVSNGCCAGLDALGTAAMWLHAGVVERVLVVSCDLPLARPILDAYQSTGILAHGDEAGMIPSEGAAALCLETTSRHSHPRLVTYAAAGEPSATLGAATELPGLRRLLGDLLPQHPAPTLCLPHESGTPAHSRREKEILTGQFEGRTPVLPLKPYTGHCVGASGLIESVIACAALGSQQSMGDTDLPKGSSVLKLSSAMGGKHSLALFDFPHE
ncbi:MAG: beta-ketoacyl synthase N-terminal-like domain-containing protein [Haloferula sp.]